MFSVRLPISIVARSIKPSVILPRTLISRSLPVQLPSTRLLSTSTPLSEALTSSAGSGKGGKAEKEAAKKAKEQARKEKEKERARKEKEREKLKAQKEKDKVKKEKEKEKLEKEKEKLKLQREKGEFDFPLIRVGGACI